MKKVLKMEETAMCESNAATCFFLRSEWLQALVASRARTLFLRARIHAAMLHIYMLSQVATVVLTVSSIGSLQIR